jgi:hypothetical protein
MKQVVLLLLVILVTAAGTRFDAVAAPSHYEDEAWAVLRVSPSGRVLVVQAVGGGCGHDPRAIVTERSDAVEIHVQQLAPADPDAICPMIARIDTMRVQLSRPIAGRPLVRQSLRSTTPAATMPRVLGLAAADARFALRAQGLRVRADRHGTVRAQRPRPLTLLPSKHVAVTLVTSHEHEPPKPHRPESA